MRRLVLLGLILLPLLNATSQTWVQRITAFATVLGDALSPNPRNSDIIYGAPGGRQLYVSRDRGYTWHAFGTAIPHVGNVNADNVIKSIAVDPLDTNRFVLGVESNNDAYDRIMRSTDGGQTWAQTWGGSFEFFGKPVEFKPYRPDTLYTMGNDTLWKSIDFGATWDTVRTTTGLFAAWCDAEQRRDSANVMFLGDFSSGIWKTYDYGKHWKLVYSTNGEIPCIAIDPFNPRRMYASKYSGGGGILYSTDWGEDWQQLNTPISPTQNTAGGPGWWVTCSQRDTGYVYFGVYTTVPGGIFVSADSGGTWRHLISGLSGSGLVNYGMLALDTLAVVALQYDGIYRLEYTPGLRIFAPNGGELLRAGRQYQISWADTNVYALRLEFTTDDGASWNLIADSLPASQRQYTWTVPSLYSTECRVRISDAGFTTGKDKSDTTFTIYTVPLALQTPAGGERWDALSQHDIRWASIGIDSINIEFSTDSGQTWSLLATVAAPPGRYRWTLPATTSTECLIRLSDPADSTAVSTSPAVFTVQSVPQFRAGLVVRDNGAGIDTLIWGVEGAATDGIDTALGESALGPQPPPGTFDARWILPDTSGASAVDLRDTLGGTHASNLYRLVCQPGSGGYPMQLHWSPDSIHSGTCILRDAATHGGRCSADMRLDSMLSVADSSIGALEILQCMSIRVSYGATPEWAMISLPVFTGSRRTSALFPATLSRAFTYESGYRPVDTLMQGTGYWLRTLPADIFGCVCAQETVQVGKGWNMIGSISHAVPAAAVSSVPAGIIASPLFGYAGGYMIADSVMPAQAYWVKTSGAGAVVLTNSPAALPGNTSTVLSALRAASTLSVGDGAGHEQRLYLYSGDGAPDESFFELPPDLPENVFAARFANGGILLNIPQNKTNSQEIPLQIRIGQTKKNSVIFTWDIDNERNFDYILVKKTGRQAVREVRLLSRGSWSTSFSQETVFSLVVQHTLSSTARPESFSLGRMYPNPFNPSTSFRYSVPEEAFISIVVYSLAGAEVAHIVNEKMAPGEYESRWNGRNAAGLEAASGVYFVRMVAAPVRGGGSFSAVERAVLVR